MPKLKNEIEYVRNLFHTIAVANGHDNPDGYADKAAAIHAAKEPEPEAEKTEGEGNGAT